MKTLTAFLTIFFILCGTLLSQAADTELKIFTIKHGSAEHLYAVVEHLKSEEGKMSVDTNTNSLIVIDRPENLNNIAKVIEQLDVLGKEVEIKVLVLDATETFLNDIGLSHSDIVLPRGNFSAILNLIENSNSANVRSEMTVKTLSNQPAIIQATVEEVFGYAVTRHGTDWTTLSPLTREAGDVLEVTPRVNNDGTIMVTLRPSVSVFEDDTTISEKTILTQVVINNGETVSIGGVDTVKEESGESRVPFLGTRTSKRRSKENRKVIMLLTATVSDQ